VHHQTMDVGIFGVRGLGVYQWLRQKSEEVDGTDAESLSFACSREGSFLELDEHKGAPARVVACCRQPAGADACFEISKQALPCRRVQLSLRSPDGSLHEVLCSAFVGPCSMEDALEHHAKYIADQCVEGQNALVLCYGGQKSGKTCTLAGPAENVGEGQSNSFKGGFVQQVVFDVFSCFQAREEVFTIEASCLGVCMCNTGQEQLVDLLSSANQRLRVVREPMDPRSFMCEGLSRLPVRWYQRSQELLTSALLQSRAIAHDKGPVHVIFTLHLENLAILHGQKEPVTRRGKLIFVNFAGTEGLACLGMPSSGRRWSSSLEMLLQNCVDGGCSTLLLAHFRPELATAEESLATLRGAHVVMQANGAACHDNGLHLVPPEEQHSSVSDNTLQECDKESKASTRMPSEKVTVRSVKKESAHSASLDDALRRTSQGSSQNRTCQLEAKLLEAVAHSRALELESAHTESDLVDATEAVNELLEENAELSQEIACINEERLSLRQQTDMQHEKLALFQSELESYTVQAEHLQVAVSQSGNAHASDIEGMQQMRKHFVSREESLLDEVATMQRAVQDVNQSTQLRVAEHTTRWAETHRQLHLHAQQLQDQAATEDLQLDDAQQARRVMQHELQNLKLQELTLQKERERKQFHQRRQLESTKARQQELLSMLHELEKGLVHTDDNEIGFEDGMLPTH